MMNPVALNSGTSALHLAVVLAGVGPGDEVICPAQTFVATAMVVEQERAVPVFADIHYDSGNLDPKSLESKIRERTKAIIAVHWGGYPCDMDAIHAIARKHDLVVIEDAAHALGATYKGCPIGALSEFTCFSFQAIKHITTGDGGALCCMNPNTAQDVLKRRWFGIDRASSPMSSLGERIYDIDVVGYKYHMNDYAAALGLANLIGFAERLARRRKIAAYYMNELKNIAGVNLFEMTPDRESACWLFGMHVERRDDFITALQTRGITASVVHLGIDHNTLFGGARKDLHNQIKFNQTQIHIPLHDGLSDDDVVHIVRAVSAGW
jgi:perosamine synthetase